MSKMKNEYGDKVWRNEAGQYHRVDGPAYIHQNRSQAWYINGKLHRIDGPAFIYSDGSQAWLVNGERHRLDGPAIICANGYQKWYIHGNVITDKVKFWMKENDFPDYTLWTATQKIMFRLAFSGISS